MDSLPAIPIRSILHAEEHLSRDVYAVTDSLPRPDAPLLAGLGLIDSGAPWVW
jgi:hypothetical protein